MVYGLIGKSLVHSYSGEIHEALGKYAYKLFSMSHEEMEAFVRGREFSGLNVTIPYKKDVIPLCDRVTDLAQSIGAVNTLYWEKGAQGKLLTGHNTDYEGFLYAASRADMDFSGRTVLILGSGGTSLMAKKAVSDRGAQHVYIASRKGGSYPGRADGENETVISYESLPAISGSVDVLINTTPVGTFPGNLQRAVSLADFPACRAVIDVIYNPFKTALLLDAEERGVRFSNGLPMLVAQATAAAGYFLGTPGAFESENERIISLLESRMENIVLIGMPGSGKSTIGRLISERTGKDFIDMDEETEKSAGMTIPEIFKREGEEGFRRRETETALELGKRRGLVIATGGGTVLKKINVRALRQNGRLLHIRRPAEDLPTDGRPLSKDTEALRRMEKERLPLYEEAADAEFDNSVSLPKEVLADKVMDALGLI